MKHLFWLDMEMSGLDPHKERILEVALVVTDMQFNAVFSFERVVFQQPSVLQAMDAWCTKHHGESGLTAKVATGTPEKEVELELIEIVKRFSKKNPAVLAGNSIGQDRKFIDLWMPDLANLLHYRMLDVSSFKIVFENIYDKRFHKQKKHRAIDDILESIEELKYYLSFIPKT